MIWWINPSEVTWKHIIILLLICLTLLGILAAFGEEAKPDCPAGSVATHVQSQWLCTVKPMEHAR